MEREIEIVVTDEEVIVNFLSDEEELADREVWQYSSFETKNMTNKEIREKTCLLVDKLMKDICNLD